MRHFLNFLCYPYAPADRSVRWGKKMRIALGVLVVMLVVNIALGLLQTLLVSRGLIADAIGGFEKPAYIREMSSYAVFLEFVVLAPLLEELAFRGLLQRSSMYIRASLAVGLYLLVCTVFDLNFYIMDRWTLLIAVCSGMFFFLTRAYLERIKGFLDAPKVRLVLLWCGSILFALWHYHNFTLEGMGLFTAVVHLLPFFINGLLLAWVGVRFGLPWGIAVHAMNNAWPFLLLG